MWIFTIIAIVIIFFLWFNTSVYDYEWTCRWEINKDSERRLPFTIWRILGLALLLIPWWNIGVFIVYLTWYLTMAMEPEVGDGYCCTIYRLDVEKYSPFLYKVISFIWDLLNKRIV